MTAQPSSQAEREDVAREVLASLGDEHFAAAVLHGDSLDHRMSFNGATVLRAMLAFSDREHATPRSMPEEVVEAYERAAKVAEGQMWAAVFVRASARDGDDRPEVHNDACEDIAAAIRALIPGASA